MHVSNAVRDQISAVMPSAHNSLQTSATVEALINHKISASPCLKGNENFVCQMQCVSEIKGPVSTDPLKAPDNNNI